MLERFCDAVVHLGPPPSFRILDPNPRLASMLLYEDDRRLQGKSIANFIASEDDYSRMVTALEEENSRNVALNLHLRDANGGEFAVTAYFSCFHDFGTDLQFVVGMVEPQERTCFSIEHVSSSIFDNAATSRASSKSTTSSEAYSTTMNLFDSTDYLFPAEAALVWVDAWTADLVVVQCNSKFAALCGPSSARVPLSNWIEQRKSKASLSKLADDIIQHSVSFRTDLECDLGEVSIKPPGLSQMRYTATCTAHCKAHCEDDKEGNDNHGVVDGVELVFILTHIKISTKYSRQRRDLVDLNSASSGCFISL
jgi:PAS domain-containing protein